MFNVVENHQIGALIYVGKYRFCNFCCHDECERMHNAALTKCRSRDTLGGRKQDVSGQ